MSDFTEEQALKMDKPCDKFLVKLEDNTYGVKFNGFRLRDMEKEDKIYHEYYPKDEYELDYFADHMLDYPFPNDILKGQKHLGTKLNIAIVGDKVVKDIVLLERHYIEGKLAANFRFPLKYFLQNQKMKSNLFIIYQNYRMKSKKN